MATVGFKGRRNHDEVNAFIAHLPGVKATVWAEGKKIQARAEALFASHDRPGGHHITGGKGITDYVVSLEGPVPVVIEFGREAFTRKSDGVHIGAMQGLHILGRAAGL